MHVCLCVVVPVVADVAAVDDDDDAVGAEGLVGKMGQWRGAGVRMAAERNCLKCKLCL